MGADVAFWILAVVAVAAALAVVSLRNVFHAALMLVLCFFMVAGIYVVLSADFLAAMQVLIYIGAITILLVFAVMFTRETEQGSPSGRLRIPAAIVAAVLMAAMITAVVSFGWVDVPALAGMTNVSDIGQALFSESGFVLPLEIAGVMLLAAAIGAMVIMRER